MSLLNKLARLVNSQKNTNFGGISPLIKGFIPKKPDEKWNNKTYIPVKPISSIKNLERNEVSRIQNKHYNISH